MTSAKLTENIGKTWPSNDKNYKLWSSYLK